MADTYNGWTNYATWRVNLEMIDGAIGCFDLDMLLLHKGTLLNDEDVPQVAENIKEFCEERIQEGTDNDLALSYALAFLSDVNWREIAEHMIEAYADN